MSTYAIQYSPLSGNINVGRANKAQTEFTSKDELTMPALVAAAQCVLEQHDGEIDLTPTTGVGPAYRVTVERIDNPASSRDD